MYKYIPRLTIFGAATYPEDRAGQRFEVTFYGDESPSRRVFATLKDIHERGEYGQPLYRQYRGQDLQVFRKPPGLGLLNKFRGEPRWTAWLNVAARLVSECGDMQSRDGPSAAHVHFGIGGNGPVPGSGAGTLPPKVPGVPVHPLPSGFGMQRGSTVGLIGSVVPAAVAED